MSMDLMVKAMKTKVGNPLRKLVLLKLADNASDQGECWPSYQYVADQCEISKRVVQLHIKALEKTGILSKTIRKGVKGNSSNVYILNFHLLVPIYNEKKVICGYLLPSESDAPPSESDAPPSESDAPPSESDAPPSESDALGGGEPDAPRTSHSLEPVNESVIEPKELLSDSAESNAPAVIDDSEKFDAKAKRQLLTEEFERFWFNYGRRGSKKPAKEQFLKIKLPRERNQAIAFLENILGIAKQWGDLYAQHPSEVQFQPHAVRWIRYEKWNDEELPTIRQGANGGDWATDMVNEGERF